MSNFNIVSITVSCEVANKNYGNGNARFVTLTAKVPEGEEGTPIGDDSIITDGIQMYFQAWQTVLQSLVSTNELSGNDYRKSTASVLTRLTKVRDLYEKLKSTSLDELNILLAKLAKKETE